MLSPDQFILDTEVVANMWCWWLTGRQQAPSRAIGQVTDQRYTAAAMWELHGQITTLHSSTSSAAQPSIQGMLVSSFSSTCHTPDCRPRPAGGISLAGRAFTHLPHRRRGRCCPPTASRHHTNEASLSSNAWHTEQEHVMGTTSSSTAVQCNLSTSPAHPTHRHQLLCN
jgi:hypothetical protein